MLIIVGGGCWVAAVSLTVEMSFRLKLRYELILICRHTRSNHSILGF